MKTQQSPRSFYIRLTDPNQPTRMFLWSLKSTTLLGAKREASHYAKGVLIGGTVAVYDSTREQSATLVVTRGKNKWVTE